MHTFISKKVAPAVLALSVVGGVVGGAAAVASAAPKVAAHAASGVVVSANAKTDEITVKVGKVLDHFKASAATKVTIAGKSGKIGALKKGEKVTVHYTESGKVLTATTVAAAKA
ncbi:MAG TPA: hypothetical protein VND23_02310 [Acidimicrobiales bacterium]|nr:hypothetical protein [Acidimicrobiales bacterium]